jgi:hypothetical protein
MIELVRAGLASAHAERMATDGKMTDSSHHPARGSAPCRI